MARDVLLRVVQIGTAIGLGMMLLIFNFRSSIPRIFSQDPAVVKLAADTLIVIALYLVRPAGPLSCELSVSTSILNIHS